MDSCPLRAGSSSLLYMLTSLRVSDLHMNVERSQILNGKGWAQVSSFWEQPGTISLDAYHRTAIGPPALPHANVPDLTRRSSLQAAEKRSRFAS